MVWHVHFKDGKFNIWSTIIDEYILTEWVSENVIIEVYQEKAKEEAKETAQINIDHAKKHKCSAMLPFRCEKI